MSRVTLYTAGHLQTAVPHCSHSRASIVHTAVPRENNEHGCVYLRCRAECKLPGCVEGHPCMSSIRLYYGSNHWGRVTHIWVNKLNIIGSDNSLAPGRRQAIIWTNVNIFLIGPLGTKSNFSETIIDYHTFYSRECFSKYRLEDGGHFVSASINNCVQ